MKFWSILIVFVLALCLAPTAQAGCLGKIFGGAKAVVGRVVHPFGGGAGRQARRSGGNGQQVQYGAACANGACQVPVTGPVGAYQAPAVKNDVYLVPGR